MEERRKYSRTEIDEPAYVPARFRLVMAKDSSVRECVVAWIRQNRIGLTFVAAPNTEGK
jgi:hypothetical protein